MQTETINSALEWSETLFDGEIVEYGEAEKAVSELGDGWRMPTLRELESLLDRTRHSPAINSEKFPGTIGDFYWTNRDNCPCAWNEDCVWVVDFGCGIVDYFHHRGGACVRAVRGNQ